MSAGRHLFKSDVAARKAHRIAEAMPPWRSILKSVAAPCLAMSLIGAAPSEDINCAVSPADLRVNDLQYITVHNAFHIAPDEAVLTFVRSERLRSGISPAAIDRELAAHDYTHPTLTRQLEMGVRALEIDVHDDPAGGRFSVPDVYREMPAATVQRLPPIDPQNDLAKPGFKTFHETAFDMRSRCLLFASCLREIAAWHRAHPDHLPIFILLEMKVDTEPMPSSADRQPVWKRLQSEILAQFSPQEMILPTDIARNSVEWPSLTSARGKVGFLLFDYGDRPTKRYADYISSSGDSPLLHVEQAIGTLRATWQSRNNLDAAANAKPLDRSLLLYTKADTMGVQDEKRRNRAISSPVNFIATDYEMPDLRRSRYAVSFGGRYARAICGQKKD